MTDREITAQNNPRLYADIQAVKQAMHQRYPQYDALVNKVKFFITDDFSLLYNAQAVGSPNIRIGKFLARDLDSTKMQGVLGHELAHKMMRDTLQNSTASNKADECRADFISDQALPGKLLKHFQDTTNSIDDLIHAGLDVLHLTTHPSGKARIDMLGNLKPSIRDTDVKKLRFDSQCKITPR